MTVKHGLKLPLEISQPAELSRLIREIIKLDDILNQKTLRSEFVDNASLPVVSFRMKKLLELLNLDIIKAQDRQHIKYYLEDIEEQAPIIHISFASEPSDSFLHKLIEWLRKEINPIILVAVGLEPNIGVGSIVRTTNHYFNFSLGSHLQKNNKILSDQINQLIAVKEPT
jgi:F0F1-type ATP synthase delta subunit